MADEGAIGLPPPRSAPAPLASAKALWFARGVNLFGLVSPASNLGLVWVGRAERRWFGLGVGVVCAAALVYAWNRNIVWLQWTAGIVHYAMVVVGLLHPLWVEKVGDGWAAFGMVLGKVMAFPIFGLLYYLVVTPTALLMRAMGKDPLGTKPTDATTYWSPHEPPGKDRYERQF
jgi:hypothetical protein